MCICSDRLAVQDCEMHYMNAWLKRCVFNLDLNRESVSEPRTFSGRLFQSLGARYEKVLPPFVDFAILGTTKSIDGVSHFCLGGHLPVDHELRF